MHPRSWWLRLQVWQWLNHWRGAPVRSLLVPSTWLLLALVLPAALALAGASPAAATLDLVLSFDVPLQLLLAVQVGIAMLALQTRVDPESWIAPAPARGQLVRRMLSLARLLRAACWPLGLALATLLLSSADPASAAPRTELLLVAGFALLGGASLAWLLRTRRVNETGRASRSRGLAALSWVSLHEASRHLDPRRLAMLAVPVMLAAPMASTLQQVMRSVAAWVLLLYIGEWIRHASRTARDIRRWMPHLPLPARRLHWYVWRYVILAAALALVALWSGVRLTRPGSTGAT